MDVHDHFIFICQIHSRSISGGKNHLNQILFNKLIGLQCTDEARQF